MLDYTQWIVLWRASGRQVAYPERYVQMSEGPEDLYYKDVRAQPAVVLQLSPFVRFQVLM